MPSQIIIGGSIYVLLDQPPSPSFDRFPLLPAEIQILIWYYALQPHVYNPQSRMYALEQYTLSHPLPHANEYRPLITSPPEYKYLSKAELAERERNPPPQYWPVTVYTKLGRREKWRGLFNLLHSCKLARQLGLEAWLSGIEDKYEGKHAPKEVEQMFILRDLIQLLKELLKRVKR